MFFIVMIFALMRKRKYMLVCMCLFYTAENIIFNFELSMDGAVKCFNMPPQMPRLPDCC